MRMAFLFSGLFDLLDPGKRVQSSAAQATPDWFWAWPTSLRRHPQRWVVAFPSTKLETNP